MASDDKVYDLRRIEDVFACLEAISMAQGVLFGVDPALAARLGKVTEALGAFSELVAEGGLEPQPAPQAPAQPGQLASGAPVAPVQSQSAATQPQQPPVSPVAPLQQDKHGFVDLVGGGVLSDSSHTDKGLEPSSDGIVDILTGKKIK